MSDHPVSAGVEGWRALVDTIAESGAAVADLAADATDVDVAEGFRYILNVLGDQLDRGALRDSAHPCFVPGVTAVRKLFFDNPDTDYDTALISGSRTYRIHGHRGAPTYLAFCVYAGSGARGGGTRVANLADANMTFADDGSFEVTLSATEQAGNWIPLEADAHTVIARQYFLDRNAQANAQYAIDVVGDAPPDPILDTERFAGLARATAAFVGTATDLAMQRAERMSRTPHQFFEMPGHGLYGTPDAGYVVCWYELEPGQALVIDAKPPECRYWGAHLSNRWGQSLDHRTRRTVLNARTTTLAPDGSFRMIVAGTEPGEANWLDTAGHQHGFVLFRWLLSDVVVVPDAQVVTI